MVSSSSFANELPIAGLILAVAGVVLICLNLRHARRVGPQTGGAGLARAMCSWAVVIAGGFMILVGVAMLLAPAAAI